MGTKILVCTCEHEYQDKRYGKKKRVCTPMKIIGGTQQFRCTICSRVLDGGRVSESKK